MKIKAVPGIMGCVEAGKLDAAVAFFRDVLGAGIGPEMPWLLQYGHRARCAYVGTDELFEVELAEAVDENLPIGRQVKRVAPSFSMLGLDVDDIDACIAELRAKGVRVSDKMKIDDSSFAELWECMIHPKSTSGFIVELLQGTPKEGVPAQVTGPKEGGIIKVRRVSGINAMCVPGTMDDTTQFFRDALGAKIGPEMTWRRKFGMRARGAWLGSFRLEISESTDDTLPSGKQHKRYAPAYQVFGLQVDDIDEAIANLRRKGITVSDKIPTEDPAHKDQYQAWIHPKETFGLILELLQLGQTPPDGEW
ncbi:MAG: VOC family protein [Chloroflexi bacterium]|nr:VOC family protein [Chloroflexota bacterium]